MALTHLLDSSVLTRLHHAAVRDAIEPAAERGELARAGIGDLEIGYSARSGTSGTVWQRLFRPSSWLRRIAAVTGQSCEWIVPAGSVD